MGSEKDEKTERLLLKEYLLKLMFCLFGDWSDSLHPEDEGKKAGNHDRKEFDLKASSVSLHCQGDFVKSHLAQFI